MITAAPQIKVNGAFASAEERAYVRRSGAWVLLWDSGSPAPNDVPDAPSSLSITDAGTSSAPDAPTGLTLQD